MDNLELAQEKLYFLQRAWILETKADIIFELKHKIYELKQQITELSPDLKPLDDIKEVAAVFYVPRVRSEYFTGRKEVLEELYDKLHQNQVVALNQKTPSIALHGLGGIGKTQILIEYANRCKDKGIHQAILWVSADSKETFESGFQTLAIELHLPVEGKPFDEIRKSVENWLIANKNKWLLLIDNADELEIIKMFLSKIKGHGQILISTRAQSTRPFAEPIEIDKMTDKEAIEFLEKRTGLSIDQHTKKLVSILGNLPLALDQAAAYICATQMSFEDYLKNYQSYLEERGELFEETDHPDPITKTWQMSFDKVQENNELAIGILIICAFLSPDGIIEEVFGNIPKKDFNDALKEILKYSLLKRDSQAKLFFMHRLVQEVLRAQLSDDDKKDLVNQMVTLLANAYPDWKNPDFIWWLTRCTEWLLNAREAQQWIHLFQLQSGDIGTLLNQMAYFLKSTADFHQALPLYEESLNIRKEVLGKRHPDYAQSLNNLASLYQDMGKPEQALPLYEESLNIRKEVLGKRHPDYASSLNNLAELYRTMGKPEQALPLYEEALKIDEKVYGRKPS